MATLSYNEILPKKIILHNGEPFVVLAAHVFRKQQRKPVNQTKLRGLKSGRVVEQTFHQNETAVEAEVDVRTITFVYARGSEYIFHEAGDPGKRFSLASELVGAEGRFLKAKSDIEALTFDDEVIGLRVPIKVELTVTEADPAVKGNTAQGATKEVTIETGAKIQVPQFIGEGDIIRINTETGEYAERVEKA